MTLSVLEGLCPIASRGLSAPAELLYPVGMALCADHRLK